MRGIYTCIGKPKTVWWKRRDRLGLLNPIHGDPTNPTPESIGPFSGGLPAKIDAGETKSFYFPYIKDCFLKDELARVGVNDTYHRNIWCQRHPRPILRVLGPIDCLRNRLAHQAGIAGDALGGGRQ